MRNLKKILALVLALIMSLSLMATAGATDFKDDENISDTYRQAAQVLSELGVFNGDQNGQFNPEKPITRAEVAAILYRIATGDIGLEGNKTYAPYNQFPDVSAEDWYAGYVTYCANAGYIKGRNTGKFDAKDNVTGYEVLAMILRAVGYDKNNEFVGSDWQLHTASIAREKGVLRNVLEDPNVKLSEPATREVVAELLFRASLLPQVTWNAATLSYVENGETLAYENLGMEQVEGVVIANEWADLRDETVTSADQTVLKTAGGERTLAVGTDLTDIGESRYAYVVGSKVLGQLENTGKNVTKDCVDLDPAGGDTYVSALAGNLDLKDAEYFINFSYGTKDTSEYRIEYSVSFRTDEAKEWFETTYLGQNRNDAPSKYQLEDEADAENEYYKRSTVNELKDTGNYYDDTNATTKEATKLGRTFSRVIPAGETITQLDKDIMNGIFSSAASFDSTHPTFIELSADIIHTGYVYAGTKSNPNTTDRKDDLSDDMTYKQFADQYIGTDSSTSYAADTNGEWLKVIDNNSDGKAEYVLRTWYDLVEVESYNDREDLYYFTGDYDSEDAVCRNPEYEFAVGDLLLVAPIDGQYVIEEANTEVVVVEKYTYKDDTVTLTDGRVLEGSGLWIENTTGYAEDLYGMVYGVEYEVIYDHYGFIRAYRPIDSERKYGLLTDLYLTNHRNTHYIDDQIATVELSFLDENGKLDMKEYDVANHSKDAPNAFVGVQQVINAATNEKDNLQRAIAHLDLPARGGDLRLFNDNRTKNLTNGEYENANTALGQEFDYDTITANNANYGNGYDPVNTPANDAQGIRFSGTNVARYTINEDGTVNLTTAAEYALNKANVELYYWNGATADVNDSNAVVGGTRATAAEWKTAYEKVKGTGAWTTAIEKANLVHVYAVDYVMLDTNAAEFKGTIGSGTYRFPIDDSYKNGINVNNWHVNATVDTVFYVATDAGVYPFVGYKNLPAINAAEVTAMYAVARNIEKDNDSKDYWVADVIVIEVPSLANVYGHMIYNVYDNYRQNQRGIIHELNAIDCTTGEIVSVIVDDNWAAPRPTGFYVLSNAEVAEDGTVTASGIQRVEDNKLYETKGYAGFGIYAGQVVRSNEIDSRGSYIEIFDETTDVNVHGDERRVELSGAPWYAIGGYYTQASVAAGEFTATQLSNRDYIDGKATDHEVIYVMNGSKVVFVIDTSFGDGYYQVTTEYLNDGYRVFETKTDIDSVYEEAMVQQTEGNAPSTDPKYDYTVTIVAAEGSALNTTKTTYYATKGEDVSILKTALTAPTGWTAGSITVKVGDAAAMDIADAKTAGLVVEDTTYYIFKNVQKNITVTVTNTANNATLVYSGPGTCATADMTKNGTTTKNVALPITGTPSGYVSGNTFKMTVTGLDSNANDYTVTGGTITWVNSTTAAIEGTLVGATTVSLAATAKETTTINVTVADATVKFTTKNPSGNTIADITSNSSATVLPDQNIVFSVTADDDYAVKSVKATQTGKEIPMTYANGVYTIDKSYNNGKTITLAVTTESTDDITVTITDSTAGNALYVTGAEKDTATTWLVPYTGGTVTIEANNPINVSVDDTDAATLTHDANYYSWNIKVTGDVTVIVTDRAIIEEDVGVNPNPGGPEDMAGQTGSSYSEAYRAAGITITADAQGNAVITVDKSDFAAFMKDYENKTTMSQILTLRPWEGTQYTQDFLAAGVIFTAPDGAASVKITESFVGEAGAPDVTTANLETAGNRGVFDANGVHTYVRFTNTNAEAWNASNDMTAPNEYVGAGISAINQTRVKTITMEFFDAANASGNSLGIVERTVTLEFVD